MPDGAITSRDVNRVLRELVWPALAEEGFTRRTERRAWRDRPDQVDVVTFWSHNEYNAGALDVTTYSFQLELGTLPNCRISPDIPSKHGHPRPAEHQCDFRRGLRKRRPQIETSHPEIWFVRPDGSNIRDVVEDALKVLTEIGLPWFASLESVAAMLMTARTVPEGDTGETWGMGNIGSPARLELLAALEDAVGARM